MPLKPGGKFVHIREQILEDPASGLILMFSVYPQREGEKESYRLRICGDALPYGNRDLIFTEDGECGAAGTATGGACEASWLREVVSEEDQKRRQEDHDRKIEEMAAADIALRGEEARNDWAEETNGADDPSWDDWEGEVTVALRRQMDVSPSSGSSPCNKAGCGRASDFIVEWMYPTCSVYACEQHVGYLMKQRPDAKKLTVV